MDYEFVPGRDDFPEPDDEILKLRSENADYAKDVLRLLETIKYLRGIAERGEGREVPENESVESFVLGYVKKLEAENAALAAQSAKMRSLPDLSTPVINRWKAEGMREAADRMDAEPLVTPSADCLRRIADKLEGSKP